MRYLIGTLKVVFLLLAGGVALSLIACAGTYLLSGESDMANAKLVMELSVFLVVTVVMWQACKRWSDSMAIPENHAKDPFLYYRDPARVYKKIDGKL